MLNTTQAAAIQQSGHIRLGDPYTLQFNLEISRESMLDFLKYLTGNQILRTPTVRKSRPTRSNLKLHPSFRKSEFRLISWVTVI